MRSLRSFLLEEALLYESVQVPEGFKRIQLKGRITNQLKDLIGVRSASEMNFENENLKITTPQGKEEIQKDLGLFGAKDFIEVFKKLIKAKQMSSIFTGEFEKYKKDTTEGIKLTLRDGFEDVGGTRTSTLKFIKFWCSCAYIACGLNEEDVKDHKYFQNEDENILLVIK